MASSTFQAVLFDLDGTLLQVEMPRFIPRYVAGYHAFCDDLVALDPLSRAMRAGIKLLLSREDGQCSNEEHLFRFVAARLELDEAVLRERFTRYQASGFSELSGEVCPIPETEALLDLCRASGIPTVLATNPVFPQSLIEARCHWVGIDPNSFVHVTSFENSRYCKPQKGYFLDIAERLSVDPRACLMIGNDTSHDLSACEAGMTTWLVDRFMLERSGPTWSPDHRGDHGHLLEFLQAHL